MAKRYNLNKITSRRSYMIKEITALLGIDRKSCQRWIKDGLKVVDKNESPILIFGNEIISFIKNQRQIRRIKLKENEYLCLKCHKAVKVKNGSEKIIKTGKKIGKDNKEQIKKIGLCEICGTKVNKFLRVCQQDL